MRRVQRCVRMRRARDRQHATHIGTQDKKGRRANKTQSAQHSTHLGRERTVLRLALCCSVIVEAFVRVVHARATAVKGAKARVTEVVTAVVAEPARSKLAALGARAHDLLVRARRLRLG